MRACSFVCIIIFIIIIIDQFYRGLDYGKLFMGGFILVAIWTDCSKWFLRKYKKKVLHYWR